MTDSAKRRKSMDDYALTWAIAVLREDMRHTWEYIGWRLNINPKRAAFLHTKIKPHYNYEQVYQSNGNGSND
jgi:hypothetical protein